MAIDPVKYNKLVHSGIPNHIAVEMADTATPFFGGGGGGGGILAATHYNPASSVFYNPVYSASYALSDVDATNLAVTFTVPASGKVVVLLEATCRSEIAGANQLWGLRQGTTEVAAAAITYAGVPNARISAHFPVTLTADDSVTLKWGATVTDSSANAARIFAGGIMGPASLVVFSA